jgi:hypothetical protein
MPNNSRNLTPRYIDGIDAEIIGVERDTVSKNGWAYVSSEYGEHPAVWLPFEEGGQLHTLTLQSKPPRSRSDVGARRRCSEYWYRRVSRDRSSDSNNVGYDRGDLDVIENTVLAPRTTYTQ